MRWLVLLLLVAMLVMRLLQGTEASVRPEPPVGVVAPGNIIIGGLFPIHQGVKKTSNLSQLQTSNICVDLSITGLSSSLAMIYTLEKLNHSPLLTRLGITLGYRIHDTCSDVTTALRATENLMSEHWDNANANRSTNSQNTMAVIGAYHSEMSIAVARELNLELIPQISYGSTADVLSDKDRFPAFSRTVPSDLHQTAAMVKLLRDNDWKWVGVLSTDGDYGRSATDNFISQALAEGICVAFKEVLPDTITEQRKLQVAVNRAIHTIHASPRVKVLVSFAKPEHMRSIFQGLLTKNRHRGGIDDDRRLWVASDSWSTSGDILSHEELRQIGWVVGFSFESADISPFKDFLRKKLEGNSGDNIFLRKYYSNIGDFNVTLATEVLVNAVQPGVVFSIELAVNAIAQSVVRLCSSDNRDCSIPNAIRPWELLPELMNSSFQMDGVWYMFNEDGDINLGYDISFWETSGASINTLNIVAEYDTSNSSLTVRNLRLDLTSKCSKSCRPGQFKKSVEGQHTCCYDCANCTENQYSNSTDMDICYSCDSSKEWAAPGSASCHQKMPEFFAWNNPFATLLLSLAALGVAMSFLISLLFLQNRNSPVVKAAGGPLSQLILVSLVGSFASTALFVGSPSDAQCMTRQVLYGLSFTLCVSCVLVKSLKILLAFQMKLLLQRLLRRFYKPYVIVCACVLLQVIICTCWLLLASPRRRTTPLTTTILEECDEGSNVVFAVMLGYIALLALACFVLAFQGRKLPEKYNEAKFITFGMLIYLMAWIIFIPTYVNTSGVYLPAVETVVILISSYGTLSCHFFPKCYAILFRKTDNTRDAFIKSVYEYSKKSAIKIKDLTLKDIRSSTENHAYTITRMSLQEKLRTEAVTRNDNLILTNQNQHRPSLKRTFSI